MSLVRKEYVHDHECSWKGRRVIRMLWVTEDGVYYETRPTCAQLDAVLLLIKVKLVHEGTPS